MQEHLQLVAKNSGKSLEEVRSLWDEALAKSTKKGLKRGGGAHFQNSLKVLSTLVSSPNVVMPVVSKDEDSESEAALKVKKNAK